MRSRLNNIDKKYFLENYDITYIRFNTLAFARAAERLLTPSLAYSVCECPLIVDKLRSMRSAICWFVSPVSISKSNSNCRFVSGSSRWVSTLSASSLSRSAGSLIGSSRHNWPKKSRSIGRAKLHSLGRVSSISGAISSARS